MGLCEKAIVLILCFAKATCSCPPTDDIEPHCSCKDLTENTVMFCQDIMCPEQFTIPIKAIARHHSKIYSLSIFNSSLLYVPDEIFVGTHIEQIRFVNSQFMSFSESDVAFQGLEETLSEVRAINSEFFAHWDWNQLRNLHRLTLIDVDAAPLGAIEIPFPYLPTLESLGIIQAQISFIVDSAFANLPKLTILSLKENEISKLKRNMLPNPAECLVNIDLSYNEIHYLPEDFFTNMSNLERVALDENKLITLHEKTFQHSFETLMQLTLSDTASFALLFSFFVLLEANVCPSNEDMAPCECFFMFGANQISCKDVLSPEQLIPPMRSIATSKTEVLSLTIDKSSLLYLPDNLFKNTHIERVLFVNTEIMSLSESDTAFDGLEGTLEEIRATDAKFVSTWDFDQLRNLRNLKLIDVHEMILGAVDHPLPQLPELTALGIISAEISFIADDAFSNLPKLTIFNMKNNEIIEMKRSMFPDPANNLANIDLSQNKLSYLPDDFFDNMASLSDVFLDKNKFVTLIEKPFAVALGKLQHLFLSENPFRCDCRMRWLVNIRFPHYFKGECSTPESLSGRKLDSLDFKSLWC